MTSNGFVSSCRNKAGFQGIRRVVVKGSPKTPGRLRITAQGRALTAAIGAASLPLRETLVIDVPGATTVQCGELAFAAAASLPHCVRTGHGAVVVCR
jgi:hypothetical protein